jgi:hypothetical protein
MYIVGYLPSMASAQVYAVGATGDMMLSTYLIRIPVIG